MTADRRTQLETVIQTGIDSALKEVHTCLPAVVTRIDLATQTIDAQVTIKRKLSGVAVDLPLLDNVPIRYPKSATFSLTFPIEIGDHVLIIFSERSIDTWLKYGGLQDPFDIRKFSLSDAFAFPMMYNDADVIPNFSTTDLEIKTNSGDTKIIVKASEDVEITTTGEVKADCDSLTANVTNTAKIDCSILDLESSTSMSIDSPDLTVDAPQIDVTASTEVNITTPLLTVTGDLFVTGEIESPTVKGTSSLIAGAKEIIEHTHPQGPDSLGNIQQDTGGNI